MSSNTVPEGSSGVSSLRKSIQESRVSSVLNNDRKQFGKKFLFDGNEETCWNSDRGTPQWIEFAFSDEKSITQLLIQFQGGFAAKSCLLEGLDDQGHPLGKCEFHPKDTNSTQTFIMEESLLPSKRFKLTFLSSFDFYGRITIYDFDVIGK